MLQSLRLTLLTCLAMLAFAANSVLARLALIDAEIGAGGFTLIRLVSGAVVLALIVIFHQRRPILVIRSGSWPGAIALLTYAAFFSYAYIALPTGTGAIILFATVQIVMLAWAIFSGERLAALQWLGLLLASVALIWLVSPSVKAPPLLGAFAMVLAGIGWGAYSLLGRSGGDPTQQTAGNFMRASLVMAALAPPLLMLFPETSPDTQGILLAVISGAVTSGLGYAIWYTALKDLAASIAGIAQLSVPAIAAIGGVVFLAEPITLRFALASSAILAGVALATLAAPRQRKV
ncbi:MAG: DMT family transporter [Pseudomonadota bacterium]